MTARQDVQTKLDGLARLRRDGGVLHDYRAPRWDEPFIMEQGTPGERGILVPLAEDGVTAEVGAAADYIPEGMARAAAPELPEMAQYQVMRHYLRYAQMTLGMDLGSDISEGTCTMKYSPRMHEELIRGHRAADVHPWQDEDTMQGLLEIVYETGQYLKSISGMDAFTLQPGGGSHAVFTNACVMRRYFEAKGELGQRNEMITTIFSHPCDAATPMVAGFKVITVMPDENGYPDLEAFRAAVSEKTVGCMITNPEDTGIYNPQIDKYVEILHEAGALAFTDQANANGILGFARARDAGFDACHFNLHKTFSSPHGCEGPATGAYMCTDELAPYLPVPVVVKDGDRYHLDYDRPESIGRVRGFLGNWMGVIRAYAWIRNLGPEGLKEVAEISVLNNNYLDNLLMGDHGRQPAVRRRPPPARPGALQPGGAQGRHGRRHRGAARPHGRLRHPELLDEPPPVGGARAVHAGALRDLQQGRPRRVGRGDQEGRRRGLRRPAVRARLAARPADRPDAAHRGHGGPGPVGLHVAQVQEEVQGQGLTSDLTSPGERGGVAGSAPPPRGRGAAAAPRPLGYHGPRPAAVRGRPRRHERRQRASANREASSPASGQDRPSGSRSSSPRRRSS